MPNYGKWAHSKESMLACESFNQARYITPSPDNKTSLEFKLFFSIFMIVKSKEVSGILELDVMCAESDGYIYYFQYKMR